MKVAIVGVGSMARAIIPVLVEAGQELSAWNRSARALEGLENVQPLARVAQAFEQEVVITLLSDDAAVRQALLAPQVIQRGAACLVHIVMATLSPALLDELEALHRQAGIGFVAAPVFGIPAVARQGQLNILAAGASEAIAQVQPLFDAIGKKTWHLGTQPRQAGIAKIAGNMMIAQAIASIAEACALVQSHGLPPAVFADVVTQTLFACPSYQRYAGNIVAQRFEPGFALRLGLKDLGLAVQAAGSAGLALPGAERVRQVMSACVDAGLGELDWSALASSCRGPL